MPDRDLVTGSGALRVFTLLHSAVPCLSTSGRLAASTSLRGEIAFKLIHAKYDGAWELPVIGAVAAPSAVLIRPAGYVAWVGSKPSGAH